VHRRGVPATANMVAVVSVERVPASLLPRRPFLTVLAPGGPRTICPVRCFIAVWPPLTALDVLAALPRPASEAVHWTAAVQWHITLRFFGQLTEGEADAALTALTAAAASVREPVVARGGPGCRVLNRRLLVWPVAGLDGLAATVSAATAGLGRPPGGGPSPATSPWPEPGPGRTSGPGPRPGPAPKRAGKSPPSTWSKAFSTPKVPATGLGPRCLSVVPGGEPRLPAQGALPNTRLVVECPIELHL
jgi:hypothetical protein